MDEERDKPSRKEWPDTNHPPLFHMSTSTGSSSDCASSQPSGCTTPTTTPTPTKPKVEYICRWESCGEEAETSADLADHVRSEHAQKQIKKGGKKFVCLWDGCKVYNTPSMSATWLPKHVLTHCGDKPFRCVFAGCNQSYRTEKGLMRHCQSHLNAEKQNSQQKTPKSKDESPGKALKKKRMRIRRRLSMVKTDDFFDTRMAEAVRHRLVELNMKTKIDTEGSGSSIIFKSSVVCRRTDENGDSMVLLRWSPTDVIPDSWVKESDQKEHKECSIPMSSLSHESLQTIGFGILTPRKRRKQRRK
ncbi:zinc finger protein AEBP2-like [Lytechinus variegatus]|uniref:zinc finger protein AEBP2-like n=1 Tax=Lytechinus variegatus TaxID=7654 RepID=UPI001BB17157|nr:zinc finger protein AEBP2-like [Lytechinus variegatus]XP_041475576.1 zinc finger protein AEBP2-like [Lytechinus variegatus]XP_041475577.1 zinc finger protein AEBP2-like [Lytechinus variegatus]XP_041475578.1 zinc finger protein AEBP2-like [Lytechinus variegatus]XP_041475969.1 zinc finger protein AEBP2-like [Lytechinus variegatus]XP_041475971.1 zinc finger protein AEBP2-like [Lytechinus variegatus]XP_041475972.1 zinc finger protein AEBP2-like [Lytechinus variegatus]XP_041475973.1 zinc finge